MSLHDFDKLVRKSVAYEVTPKEHDGHPNLDAFLTIMASDASDETRGAVVAHVATCLSCQTRWRAVERTLHLREEKLDARVETPSLVQMVRERERSRNATKSWLWRLSRWPTFRLGPALRPALVPALVSVAAVAIALGIVVPALRSASPVVSDRLAVLTREVEALRDDTRTLAEDTRTLAAALAQAGATIPANILRPEVSAGELTALRDQAERIRDPWQRDLYVASLLNRWGIEPSSQVNWQALEPYAVRTGDTWQTLAARRLGDPSAWPVLWLLNSDVSSPDQDPPVGTTVLLPAPVK